MESRAIAMPVPTWLRGALINHRDRALGWRPGGSRELQVREALGDARRDVGFREIRLAHRTHREPGGLVRVALFAMSSLLVGARRARGGASLILRRPTLAAFTSPQPDSSSVAATP
jgi:hypothetical protein